MLMILQISCSGEWDDSSDLTKQYYRTNNQIANDDMFNAMDNARLEPFQGDGTKKTHYNGSFLQPNIIDATRPQIIHNLNYRTISTYMLRGGQQQKGKIALQPPSHPKYPPMFSQAYYNQQDLATRAKPKHVPDDISHQGRPKSAVSRRTRTTDFSRAKRTESRRSKPSRPQTAHHGSNRQRRS